MMEEDFSLRNFVGLIELIGPVIFSLLGTGSYFAAVGCDYQ